MTNDETDNVLKVPSLREFRPSLLDIRHSRLDSADEFASLFSRRLPISEVEALSCREKDSPRAPRRRGRPSHVEMLIFFNTIDLFQKKFRCPHRPRLTAPDRDIGFT